MRFLEILFSCIGLSLGLIILPFILLGNAVGNRGKLFYKQTRVGKNGIPFEIYKFRTMVKNAESEGAVFASIGDIRITPFGKLLRKTRIDEVPQFINIIKGQMAFIGPRPERPEIEETLKETFPNYHLRNWLRPGLSGWAQVCYPYGASLADSRNKLSYDLYYLRNANLFLDILILVKTIRLVIGGQGALPKA
jgi:lipopolysaccharide/colanic/teichoic acid biosynthesis glycosyltransferase